MLALNYDEVTDKAVLAMGDRMNDPVTAANVDAYVRALMGKPMAKETPDSGHEFNTFSKQQSLPDAPVKIGFIGNSITLHGAAAEIGWRHQHGMAASVEEEDYCHRLLGLMNTPKENAFIGNFAEAERVDIQGTATMQFLADLLIMNKPELTVIQLGDNVRNEVFSRQPPRHCLFGQGQQSAGIDLVHLVGICGQRQGHSTHCRNDPVRIRLYW
jgi:hypothetical protein